MSRQNVAYDLSRYEARAPVQVVDRPKIRPRGFTLFGVAPLKVIATTLFLVLVLGYMLYSRAMLTELNEDINRYRRQLNTLQAESTRLDMEAQSRMSLKNIEEYATEILGMSKIGKFQVEYIPLESGDEVRVMGEAKSLWERLLDKWANTFGT